MAFLSQVRFEDDQLPQPSMDLFSSKPGEMLCWNGEKFLHFQEGEVKPIRIRLDNPEQVRQLEFVPTKDSSTVYMIVNYEDSVAAAYSMTRDFNDVKKLFELEKTVFWRATTDNKDGLSCLRNLKNYKSTEDEFIHYNVETKQLSTHKTSLKSQLGWRLERVQSMFYDQADNLWIGTWNSGLFLFTNQDQGFMKTTFLTRAKEEKIPYYPIYAKEDTVYLVDKNGGIHVPLKQKSYEPPESEKYEIRILGMEQYGDKIYMGAGAGGILVFDLVDDSYELIRINEVEGQPKFSTTHVLIDSKERLWGISHQGAYLIEPSPTGQKYDPDNMIPYVNDGENHIMMGSNRVETIFEFDEEIYCVSQNSGGIVKFNEETQEFDELIFRTERNWRVPIKFGETIWFASFANGVLEFDLRNRKVVQEFKSSNGKLPSSWIRNAAFIDEKEFIFRGEKDTWYSFNIEEDQLKEFERYDEYEWYFANWKPLVLSDGTKLFPGTDCIYQYNHTHRADVNHSNIIFSTIEINGEDARNLCETPIEYIEEIKLTYDQNDLRINFADQLPQDSYSMTYEYMLEWIDKDWRQTYGVMVANYPELPSGEYQFMVRMVSKDGSLQSEAKTLDIKITAPWWLTIYAFIGYILVLTIVVYRLVKVRTKQLEKKQLELEEIIQEKTADIRDQKHQIEEKQKEILDSISYAKRIQGAILPADDLMNNKLSEHFVLYKPKDIVAGDFYWMEPINDGYLIAAADCTGHGVPGAMVSVICNGALNRSVREFGLLEPGKILDQARKIVIEEFDKSKEDVKDGMDIALCKIQGNEISFAGAHNALWILRDEEVIITKGDKQPIGQFESSEPFTTHKTTIQPGDIVYLFTDGYVDQFGGEKGKKLKTKAFRELLLSLKDFSMTEQRMKIDSAFEKWRGSLEQVDDVCVIGIRF